MMISLMLLHMFSTKPQVINGSDFCNFILKFNIFQINI
jgi:hypothetical protein